MYRTQASIQQEMSPVTSQIHAESVLSSWVDLPIWKATGGKIPGGLQTTKFNTWGKMSSPKICLGPQMTTG